MAKKKTEFNWDAFQKLENQESIQTEISTRNLIEHIEKDQDNKFVSEILKTRSRDVKRIQISRQLFERIETAKKQFHSCMSISELAEIIIDKVLKKENL